MSEPRNPLPSYSTLSTEEKVDEILRIVRGLASTAVEHDARIKFIESAVDMSTEDHASMAGRVRYIENAVDQLTKIAQGHQARISEHDKTIHELVDEERRTAADGAR